MKKQLLTTLAVFALFSPSLTLAGPVSGISTYQTTSQMMEGMEVLVTFAGTTSSQTGTWANTSGSSSGASGTGWSLTNNAYNTSPPPDYYDDTYFNPWVLSGTNITSFTINGMIADVMFDIWYTNDETIPNSTKDSSWGWLSTPDGWTASFADPINLIGQSVVGDLYGKITFTYNGTGSFTGENLLFEVDTDKTSDTPVPEPATMILFGIGLAGFGLHRRKKIFRA